MIWKDRRLWPAWGPVWALNPWHAYRSMRTIARGQQRIIDRQNKQIASLSQLAGQLREENRRYEQALAGHERELRRVNSQLAASVTDARVSAAVQSTAQPEFVLVGTPRPDGSKRLMASRQLDVTAFAMTEPENPPPRWKLGVILGALIVIDKPDYQQALAHLMTIWANQDSDQRAQVTGKRALGPGSQWDRPNLPR